MMAVLATLHFAQPVILLALVLLPILWWLLRVTPPAPRRQEFPAIRLLRGLIAVAQTAARTPLWLLALRLFAAALVIIALSGPTLRRGAADDARFVGEQRRRHDGQRRVFAAADGNFAVQRHAAFD